MYGVVYHNVDNNNDDGDGDGDSISRGDDDGYLSDENGSRSKQNKSGDDDEGDDKGDVDFVDDGSDVVSNPMLTGDEVVEWYDKLFISMYPDDRVQDITASHNHLRHWTYYPKPQDGTARTSHEKQWIEEHLKTSHGSQSHPKSLNRNLPPSASTIDSDYPGRPSLHEEYLTQRSSLRISLDSTSSRGSGHSTTDRPPLWQLAGYSSLKEINPVKMSIVQMLMNMDEPTVKGVLMAKNQSA